MKCPRCGADSTVAETRKYEEVFLRRARLCFNEHRFYSIEVYPGNLRSQTVEKTKRGVAARAKAWLLKLRVVRSTEPSSVLAEQHGITCEWVNHLRKTK